MRVLAALSGGVDSAVAAALAVEAGHEVVGVHMALSSQPAACRVGSRGCCSVEDAGDAARAAEIIGIPFYVWDLAEEFEEAVIADFVEQYRAGHTPNPCVRCNEFVKFRELSDRARALGFDAVCTGHYAALVDGPSGPELHRGADPDKDQSYVLAVMGPQELGRVVLPLGEAPSKAWVRAEAERRGLGVSNKPDSYDICFIPDGDTQGFLRERLGEETGRIVSPDGRVLGSHQGYWNFTVGQRRGLRLDRPAPDGAPRYVIETRPESNEVVVGAAQLLSVERIECERAVWLAADDPGEGAEGLSAQIRAHGEPIPVARLTRSGERLVVDLAEATRGVAAGQSLVVYRGTRVLGEATIASATRRGPDA
ncbi:tRNA 2-thiouridine(34) synthase MnmA [Actinomyces sp. B33]|uniref:tRNA 2-thiouridine(34) synthase MnmA n=1 Tax=Actinomyces sp. B33 TaxID=2942131 RepID=UPI0023421812|nr:tRNA 2-thiouridine(34) synthase MnmA [Actinomyces sp. B33]MDC4232877.1 tRNA 2-thiouridine(34) synthase MnmA [Actinomyces sp. B33]